MLLRKVNGTAIVQLPSKRQMQVAEPGAVPALNPHPLPPRLTAQGVPTASPFFPQVLETCVATVGRVSNVDHNKRVIGKAGRNRWLGKRPHTGLWHRKGGWAGRKIRPLPPLKSYVHLPRVAALPGQ